jgi:ribosomal-protein-serine acetyltransferase
VLPFDLPGGYRLRAFEADDAEELYALADANRLYLAEWLPWAWESNLEMARGFLDRARWQAEHDSGFQAAIVDETGAICGVVGFHGVDWNNRTTSIGYWLAADRQGRGTMTEAVRALVSHAFDAWQLHRVEIRVAVGNERSSAIPRRLGFVQEGVLRQVERHGDGFKDNVVYSILTDEWPARRS